MKNLRYIINNRKTKFYEILKEIALEENRSFKDIIKEYNQLLKESKFSNKNLNKIIKKFGYTKISRKFSLYGYKLNYKFSHYYNLEIFKKIPPQEVAIVTGFGPTNPPTAGTLASIFRAIELQKNTGVYTHITISEFGALNSRQRPLEELIQNSYKFISFIKELGFNQKNGEIRTHNDHDHARIFSLVASVLTTKDLLKNLEVTYNTYKRLNLLGNDFSRMVSRAYVISDILLPIIRDKKRGVIVPLGLEEHHHPYLARIVLERLKLKYKNLIRQDADVGALYNRIIPGLFPYFKMSKSIPQSSINLGDNVEELQKKIINCKKIDEEIILKMMSLVSDWDENKLKKAERAFNNLKKDYRSWVKFKFDYLNFFIKIKNIWENTKYPKNFNLHKEIFKK
ncbi:hypothetical protein HRbin35_00446 [bacterium HR35]|nr:hypothetical protein HRbin35_00446 [bacterium HR35]